MSMNQETELLLQSGIAAVRSGDKREGARLLAQVVRKEPQSEDAWFWLAAATDQPAEAAACLRRVLAINPNNQRAKQALGMLESGQGADAFSTASDTPVQAAPAQFTPPMNRSLNTGELLATPEAFQEQRQSASPPPPPFGASFSPPPFESNNPPPRPPLPNDPYSAGPVTNSPNASVPPPPPFIGGGGVRLGQLDPNAPAQPQMAVQSGPPIYDPGSELRASLLSAQPNQIPSAVPVVPVKPARSRRFGRRKDGVVAVAPAPVLIAPGNTTVIKKKRNNGLVFVLLAIFVLFLIVAGVLYLLKGSGTTPAVAVVGADATATAQAGAVGTNGTPGVSGTAGTDANGTPIAGANGTAASGTNGTAGAGGTNSTSTAVAGTNGNGAGNTAASGTNGTSGTGGTNGSASTNATTASGTGNTAASGTGNGTSAGSGTAATGAGSTTAAGGGTNANTNPNAGVTPANPATATAIAGTAAAGGAGGGGGSAATSTAIAAASGGRTPAGNSVTGGAAVAPPPGQTTPGSNGSVTGGAAVAPTPGSAKTTTAVGATSGSGANAATTPGGPNNTTRTASGTGSTGGVAQVVTTLAAPNATTVPNATPTVPTDNGGPGGTTASTTPGNGIPNSLATPTPSSNTPSPEVLKYVADNNTFFIYSQFFQTALYEGVVKQYRAGRIVPGVTRINIYPILVTNYKVIPIPWLLSGSVVADALGQAPASNLPVAPAGSAGTATASSTTAAAGATTAAATTASGSNANPNDGGVATKSATTAAATTAAATTAATTADTGTSLFNDTPAAVPAIALPPDLQPVIINGPNGPALYYYYHENGQAEMGQLSLSLGRMARIFKEQPVPPDAYQLNQVALEYAEDIGIMSNDLDRFFQTGQVSYLEDMSNYYDKAERDRKRWQDIVNGGFPFKVQL